MSLGTDILFLLADAPGLTSDDLAQRLGRSDDEVRIHLEGVLRPFVSKDWFKRWYLNEQLNIQARVWPAADKLSSLLPAGNRAVTPAPPAVGNSTWQTSLVTQFSAWLHDFQRWAASEGYEGTLGSLLTADRALLPPDLVRRLDALSGRMIGQRGLAAEDPFEPILAWFDSLDERRQSILTRRVLVFGRGTTLEELAAEFGVTRERVRQIEKDLIENLDRWARSLDWQPVMWRAHRMGRAAGLSCPPDHAEIALCLAGLEPATETQGRVVRAVLLRLAGPYELDEHGWLVSDAARLDQLRAQLAAGAPDGTFFTVGQAVTIAEEAGLRSIHFNEWIAKETRLKVLDGYTIPWSPFIGDRAEVVLRLRGKPMSAEQLLEVLGQDTDERSLRSRLSGDERFTRAKLSEWGLSSWELPEYQGIAAEVSRCLREAGSPLPIDEVVARLCGQFNLAESSVRALCGAPRFIIEDGAVRLRGRDEPYVVSGDLSKAPGVFQVGPARACIVLPVDAQLLKGSGRAIPEPVGHILGLQPGADREFGSAPTPVRISWPDGSISGPAIGSLRVHAERAAARLGDLVRVVLDATTGMASVKCIAVDDLSAAGIVARIRMVTGLEVADDGTDVHRTLSRAVGASTAELRRALEKRDDDWLLSVLPPETLTGGLQQVLQELGDLLDR